MLIGNDAAEEFRELYKEEFGEEISLDAARELGGNLVDLYYLLMQPLPKGLPGWHPDSDQAPS